MTTTIIASLALLLLTTIPFTASAQQLTKKEIAAIEKAEQTRLDSARHTKALVALEASQWAFESDHLTDSNGRVINAGANPQPNVFCFDGVRFYGTFLISRGDAVSECSVESNGKIVSTKTNKRGEVTYRFESVAPTRSESTITLDTASDYATLYISADGGTATYRGRLMPASESRYILKTQYGRE